MSWMRCPCGEILRNNTFPSPTEGSILAEQDLEPRQDELAARANEYLAAVRAGRRRDWLDRNLGPEYPDDLSDGDILVDIAIGLDQTTSAAECTHCGRLLIQKTRGVNDYISFRPDEPGYHGILAGKRALDQY